MNKPKIPVRREDIGPNENLCDYCSAKCCRYFALPIDLPRTWSDFQYLRWYLLHEAASIFVEDGIWYLLVHTVCKHLREDHRCGIYETRPPICREYSTKNCEFDESFTYEQYFETPEQIDEYANARFSKPETFRTPEPTGLPIVQV